MYISLCIRIFKRYEEPPGVKAPIEGTEEEPGRHFHDGAYAGEPNARTVLTKYRASIIMQPRMYNRWW